MTDPQFHDPRWCREEVERLRSRLGENDRLVADLGKALARMRDRRGWHEDEWKLDAEKRAEVAERKLQAIESSWTWKIGRGIVWLPGKVKRMVTPK